ncbi:DUF6881 domain-containing protein [Streptomyces daliensis]|uniref:DUF6881 domain-containing protein n=1 Tax=Streptomyces daliensis TaxID=299421 RepID=A0A8T4IMA4_9ACTN|nr:hypothetical protein [Streptomyces daliensis]
MEYWKVIWHHEFADEPVAIYSEIGEDGYETRKVEEFRDGSLAWAREGESQGGSVLSEIPVGSIEDVQQQPEFSAFVIDERRFQEVWSKTGGVNGAW